MARRPVVIAVMGVPGAGKTTLTTALAPHLGARIVSRDVIRAAMFTPCSFTLAEKHAAFEAVLVATRTNCLLGESTIVEGMPFSREHEPRAVREVALTNGAVFLAVLCDLPLSEAKARIVGQQGAGVAMAPDRTPALVDEVADRLRYVPPDVLRVDATQPVDAMVRDVLSALPQDVTS